MTVETREQRAERRPRLSRDRVLQAAVKLADRQGTDSLTVRILAHALGVEAMSLYYHVANKDDLRDGVVEAVVGEIKQAVASLHWSRWPTACPTWSA